MKASELKLTVTTAPWFKTLIDAQSKAAIEAVENGVPAELVQDQFESTVRSAAFDAVIIGGNNEPSE